jgi:hypothetical protein
MAKSKSPPVLPLVLVEWWDAYTQDSGWKSGKTLRKQGPVLVRTIGYLLVDADTHVTVAASWVQLDDHFDGDCVIPKGMIARRVDLMEKP